MRSCVRSARRTQSATTSRHSTELQEILDDNSKLSILRPCNIPKASEADLTTGINFAKTKLPPKEWPKTTRVAFLERRVDTMRQAVRQGTNVNIQDLVGILMPFTPDPPCACDPHKIVAASFDDYTEAGRIAMCERLLYQETIALNKNKIL